jgi:hypothetical protein
VDVHFFPFFLFPELVDLNGNGQGLFRDHNGIEIRINGGTKSVIQGFDPAGGLAAIVRDILFQFLLPCRKRADRVDLPAGKGIRGKAYHYMSAGPGYRKGTVKETFMAVVKGIERTPYHNLHTL